MSVTSSNEIPKSLAILATAVASGLALALVLSSAPVLGGRDSALAAGTKCTGGGGGGGGTPSPTATQTSGPLPGPIQTLLSPSPSPTGSASPTASPSSRMPDPALTTPTPTGSPSESPISPPPQSTRKCESRITLSYNGNRQRFSGEVRSDETACERGRRVVLKRDRRKGRDRRVAATVTNNRGRYQIPLPDRSGRRFYTKAPRQTVRAADREEVVCLGDRSRTVSTRNPL